MKLKKIIMLGCLYNSFSIPLSLLTGCSCSPKWGYQSPLVTGSIDIHNPNNPYSTFLKNDEDYIRDLDNVSLLVNLNNEDINLQSNYAIDVEGKHFYSYAQPQQWFADKKNSKNNDYLGDYANTNAGWYDSSSTIYSWTNEAKKYDQNKNVIAKMPIYSYKNNILSANTRLIGTISSNLSKYINYGLQYQASQLNNIDDTNLQIAWGKSDLNFGINYTNDEVTKRKFIEANFAALSNAGSAQANASLRPVMVNYNFKDRYFPIVSYVNDKDKGLILSKRIRHLLYCNSNESQWKLCQDPNVNKVYFTSVSSSQESEIVDGKNYTYFYRIFNYENVPIVIGAKQFVKSYVNPKKNGGYLLKDYYSSSYEITKTIGDAWKKNMPKFTNETSDMCVPKYKSFIYNFPKESNVIISPKYNDDNIVDERLQDLHGNDFILLVNYTLKEVVDLTIDGNKASDEDIDKASNRNRVTIGDIGNVFPAYFLQITNDETMFKQREFKINIDGNDKNFTSFCLDTLKVEKINNEFNNLFKKLGDQGFVQDLTKLNDHSKNLLKFLGFLFSKDKDNYVDVKDILTTIEI